MKNKLSKLIICLLASCGLLFTFGGCVTSDYSDQWLYSEDVSTIYVEMFENRTFRRNLEYTLTDALVKRIEAQTPYKVVSDRSRADSVLSGEVVAINEIVLAGERQTGRALEKLATAQAQFSWVNLRNDEYIIKGRDVKASTSYSEFQNQTIEYAKDVTANKLAQRIVELMQLDW